MIMAIFNIIHIMRTTKECDGEMVGQMIRLHNESISCSLSLPANWEKALLGNAITVANVKMQRHIFHRPSV